MNFMIIVTQVEAAENGFGIVLCKMSLLVTL